MENAKTIETLRRLELAHMLLGIRVRDKAPDRLNHHLIMVRDCRAKIDYILGIK